ncbi:Nif3-like dinuclear metal center hexameric protein [Aliidiomarina sp. Khilg15.8]
MSTHRDELMSVLARWTDAAAVKDYCPNGLQVEGRDQIKTLVTGVTASQALLEAASAANADAILVHHGYFWKGERESVTGMKKRRLQHLLAHDMNLIAYHLPLDIHAEFGNNVELARRLNLQDIEAVEAVSPRGVLQMGRLHEPEDGDSFVARLEQVVSRKLVAQHQATRPVQRVALCTGGGQGFIEAAVDAGADAFITGEVSEPTIHIARECNIHFFAAGHHATERFGVQALGNKIAEHFDVAVQFIDIDNPA